MVVYVKKVGGSLLRSEANYLIIADYLARFYTKHKALVVVVSAQKGNTNALIQQAARYSVKQGASYELLLSLGEQRSCAFLGLALESLGAPVRIFCGFHVGIYQMGETFQVNHESYQQALQKGIVLVSGFHVLNNQHQLVNLGRGGSDLTALVLGKAFHAKHCDLLKDVPGVYSTDVTVGPLGTFFKTISWFDLKQLSDKGATVVQSQAVDFALKHRYSFTVTDLNGSGTQVGDQTSLR